MKTISCFRNILLAGLWGLLLAGCLTARAFVPAINLPAMDLPLLLLISLLSLLADHYVKGAVSAVPVVSAALAAVTFGLMPLCAGLADLLTAGKLALVGGLTYLAASVLFDSMVHRLSTGPRVKAAPIVGALVLYLAGQCFSSIFF